MKRIVKYKLELVKESCKNYDIDTTSISSPVVGRDMFEKIFRMSSQAEEVMSMVALDCKNKVIGAFEISRGSLNASTSHPREIFKRAIACNAHSIILSHNHPSGSLVPSDDDLNMTRRLIECGKIVGIQMLDHIIITSEGFLSLKEYGGL